MQAISEAELNRLEDLREQVNQALQLMIENELKNGAGEVAELAGEMLLSGGKRLRPLLAIIAYEVAGGKDIEEIMNLALSFEFIHTATLVHDDINDAAKQRRGITTLHERAGQAKAIIAGDWLFVHGFGLGGLYTKSIIDLVTNCCANIAISEFMQLDHVLNLSTSPEDYLQIVRGKTAGPFAAISFFIKLDNFKYFKIISMVWFSIFLISSIDLLVEYIFGQNLLGNISYFPGRLAGFLGDELKIACHSSSTTR